MADLDEFGNEKEAKDLIPLKFVYSWDGHHKLVSVYVSGKSVSKDPHGDYYSTSGGNRFNYPVGKIVTDENFDFSFYDQYKQPRNHDQRLHLMPQQFVAKGKTKGYGPYNIYVVNSPYRHILKHGSNKGCMGDGRVLVLGSPEAGDVEFDFDPIDLREQLREMAPLHLRPGIQYEQPLVEKGSPLLDPDIQRHLKIVREPYSLIGRN
jgi:hypothetical protein